MVKSSLTYAVNQPTIVFTMPPKGTKRVNIIMKQVLKNPFITTVWPLNDRADTATALRKIKDKLFTYGIISDKEQAYLDKHSGKIDQKEAI